MSRYEPDRVCLSWAKTASKSSQVGVTKASHCRQQRLSNRTWPSCWESKGRYRFVHRLDFLKAQPKVSLFKSKASFILVLSSDRHSRRLKPRYSLPGLLSKLSPLSCWALNRGTCLKRSDVVDSGTFWQVDDSILGVS